MITYLGMTAPMAIIALVSWLKNPYNGNRAEVEVNSLSGWEIVLALVLSAIVTTMFYFKVYEYRKSDSEHHIGHNKLSCCIPDLQTKSALCNSIRT